MNKRTIFDWLSDILAWGQRLEGHVAGMNYEGFVRDPKTQDAASKCVESIGLAANEISKLDPSLDTRFPELKLNQACKARNKLSHGYYSVELEIVWQTVTVSIPKTIAAAREAMVALKSSGEATGGSR
jgi:uncharacterized protein with HEPN domain